MPDDEPTPTENFETASPQESPRWHPAICVLFRIVFTFCALTFVPADLPEAFLSWIPHSEIFAQGYHAVTHKAVSWIAANLFHIAKPVNFEYEWDHADSTYGLILTFTNLLLALCIALLWSILDRRRTNYARLHEWLRIGLRLILIQNLFSYGFDKVFLLQFKPITVQRLSTTFGETGPMGLLWTFMSYSPVYQFFGGIAEVIPGILLIFPKTTLLGAILSAIVMTNVAMLNLCYDVRVKSFSLLLLLVSVILIVPALGRLINFFLLGRNARAIEHFSLFANAKYNKIAQVTQIALGLFLLCNNFINQKYAYDRYVASHKSTPLDGLWIVDQYLESEKPCEAPWSWSKLTIDKRWLFIGFKNGKTNDLFLDVNANSHTFTMGLPLKLDQNMDWYMLDTKNLKWKIRFDGTYKDSDDKLILETKNSEGKAVKALLHRDTEKSHLLNAKFRWISDPPYDY